MKQATSTFFFIALAACAMTAGAQQFTKDGKRIGTRDDLRACYEMRDEIDRKQVDLKARADKISAESTELRGESEQLNKEVASAEMDNLTGVRRTRLERKVKEHQSKVQATKDADAALRADLEAFEKQAAAQKEKCTNVAFDNDDIAAVRKEREAAGKK